VDEERRTLGGDPNVPGRVGVADSLLDQELAGTTTQVWSEDDGNRRRRLAELLGEGADGAWLEAFLDLQTDLQGLAIGRPKLKASAPRAAPFADSSRSALVETPGWRKELAKPLSNARDQTCFRNPAVSRHVKHTKS
jgi:hypothetical protein